MWIKAKQYSGDGTLRTCSTILAQGYAIDFPPFDPGQPYTAVYRISHVPQVSRAARFCMNFHLKINPTDEEETRLTPVIRVRITDRHGRVQSVDLSPTVVSPTVPLSPSVGGWGSSSPDLFGIYGPDANLHFTRGETYSISVAYRPGSVPIPAKQAYFGIEDCAFY